MASLLHSLSSLSLSSPQITTTTLSTSPLPSPSPTTLSFPTQPPPTLTTLHKTAPDIQSVMFPSFAYSNTLFFKRPYNVHVNVYDDDTEESLIGRFRQKVFRANVIQESKRRRFFETNQEKRKRKTRDAARRQSRRRPRPPIAKKEDVPRKKRADDEQDNWDVIDVEVPYCK
nr:30S ribosomal protein S21, chloroplastic-like [Tanacetum cinerariifolium]